MIIDEPPISGHSHEFGGQQIHNELRVAIAGIQATIEQTDEDETRTRMKSVLKALQHLRQHLEVHFPLEE